MGGTAPPTACAGSGGWISVPFNTGLSVLGSAGTKGVALAVEGPAADEAGGRSSLACPAPVPVCFLDCSIVVCASPCFLLRFAVSRPVFAGFLSPAASPSASVPPSVAASPAAAASLDAYMFACFSAGAEAPFVDMTLAASAPPSISSQYPPNNYNSADADAGADRVGPRPGLVA